mmetsp:Transcript_27713/g.73618  ORF Transcript_27713/g.73618 Transcript_27713/m.73618 type:complete len:415 (+) Transcript_27713:846-2090(+)
MRSLGRRATTIAAVQMTTPTVHGAMSRTHLARMPIGAIAGVVRPATSLVWIPHPRGWTLMETVAMIIWSRSCALHRARTEVGGRTIGAASMTIGMTGTRPSRRVVLAAVVGRATASATSTAIAGTSRVGATRTATLAAPTLMMSGAPAQVPMAGVGTRSGGPSQTTARRFQRHRPAALAEGAPRRTSRRPLMPRASSPAQLPPQRLHLRLPPRASRGRRGTTASARRLGRRRISRATTTAAIQTTMSSAIGVSSRMRNARMRPGVTVNRRMDPRNTEVAPTLKVGPTLKETHAGPIEKKDGAIATAHPGLSGTNRGATCSTTSPMATLLPQLAAFVVGGRRTRRLQRRFAVTLQDGGTQMVTAAPNTRAKNGARRQESSALGGMRNGATSADSRPPRRLVATAAAAVDLAPQGC